MTRSKYLTQAYYGSAADRLPPNHVKRLRYRPIGPAGVHRRVEQHLLRVLLNGIGIMIQTTIAAAAAPGRPPVLAHVVVGGRGRRRWLAAKDVGWVVLML